MEIWKPVVGWEKYYEVSNLGRVRSLIRMSRVSSANSGVRKMGGVIRKLSGHKGGYKSVSLTAEGRRKLCIVHRLVLEAFIGKSENKLFTRHLNGNPADNRLENLKWGSHLENMADRKKHGNYPTCESHPNASLTNAEALYIYNSNLSGEELAKKFNVKTSRVSAVRQGVTYKEVTGGVPLPRHKTFRKTDKIKDSDLKNIEKLIDDGLMIKDIASLYNTASGSITYAINVRIPKLKKQKH